MNTPIERFETIVSDDMNEPMGSFDNRKSKQTPFIQMQADKKLQPYTSRHNLAFNKSSKKLQQTPNKFKYKVSSLNNYDNDEHKNTVELIRKQLDQLEVISPTL